MEEASPELAEFSEFWASSGLADKQPLLQLLAGADVSLMILGETGAGKTHLARWIHAVSPRRNKGASIWGCGTVHDQNFVAALFGHEKGAFTGADRSELGLLRGCDGGTLVLDDINLLPLDDQARLLQFLDSGSVTPLGAPNQIHTVDVRVIVTSNEDPWRLVKRGVFREDLYHRLAVMPIRLPPLSERNIDLVPLVRMYEEQWRQSFPALSVERSLSDGAIRLLDCFDWPGNYRGLRNIILQILVYGVDKGKGPIRAKNLFDLMQENRIGEEQLHRLRVNLEKEDRGYLDLLRATDWNPSLVARIAGVTRPTVYTKINKFGWSREKDGVPVLRKAPGGEV